MDRIICFFCFILLLLILPAGTCAAEEDVPEGAKALPLTRIDAMPGAQWQCAPAFPDWNGSADNTLAMNNMYSFQFFHGQGTIYLDVREGVTAFDLYVNGHQYDTSGVSQGIWAADLTDTAVNGVNTLQLTNIAYAGGRKAGEEKAGDEEAGEEKAVTVYIPYPEVLPGTPEEEGIRPETLALISDLITSDVEHGFTSAQLAVIRNGRLVYENAWGHTCSYKPDGSRDMSGAPVTTDTLYDLASVTKMFSTVYAVQKLVDEGPLDVDAPIVDILGEAFAEDTLDLVYLDAENPPDIETQKEWKRSLTVRDILCHEAGFPPSPWYNNPDYDLAAQKIGEPGTNPAYAASREEMLPAIFKTPLLYAPHAQTLYSDVDYMLATFIIEKITGMRLDAYMKETFYEPLGLTHTTFAPLENGFDAADCAATELNGNTRDGHIRFDGVREDTIQGEVHDERAFYCMEGISGHAGLFSNASDLAKLANVMLTGGSGDLRFFSRNVIDLFTAPKSAEYAQWGLGWWRQGDIQRPRYFGTRASSGTIGHQGWTGTLVMIDPARALVVVYLTNKINSPVLDAEPYNSFAGSCFTASSLGFVPQILSIGMDSSEDISGELLDLLADMASESLKLIPEEGDGIPYYRENALSKAEVFRKYAAGRPAQNDKN